MPSMQSRTSSSESAARPAASEGASPASRIIGPGDRDRDRPSYGDTEGEPADRSLIASLLGPVLKWVAQSA
jgi:hypothetical protein